MAEKMNKKKRIEYAITTACVLLSGFVIYGLIGSMESNISDSKVVSFLAFGAIGGFGFSMLLSTVFLSLRFFRKKSLRFKTVSAILWPVTLACCFFVGVLMYFPYEIYNLIQLVKKKPQLEENPSNQGIR